MPLQQTIKDSAKLRVELNYQVMMIGKSGVNTVCVNMNQTTAQTLPSARPQIICVDVWYWRYTLQTQPEEQFQSGVIVEFCHRESFRNTLLLWFTGYWTNSSNKLKPINSK